MRSILLGILILCVVVVVVGCSEAAKEQPKMVEADFAISLAYTAAETAYWSCENDLTWVETKVKLVEYLGERKEDNVGFLLGVELEDGK